MDVTQVQSSTSFQTIFTPASPSLTVGSLIVPSRANLVPSPNALEAANVEVLRGTQWIPPSSATPSTSNPTPPVSNPVVIQGTTVQGKVTLLSAPIINSDEASIVTVNPDGTTTVDENNASTTAADLSKYTKGFVSGKTVSANGTITVYSGATQSSLKSAGSALDVTA